MLAADPRVQSAPIAALEYPALSRWIERKAYSAPCAMALHMHAPKKARTSVRASSGPRRAAVAVAGCGPREGKPEAAGQTSAAQGAKMARTGGASWRVRPA